MMTTETDPMLHIEPTHATPTMAPRSTDDRLPDEDVTDAEATATTEDPATAEDASAATNTAESGKDGQDGKADSGLPRTSDVRRAFALIWAHRGGNKPYVLALLMLVVEALTAVVEPLPIAYIVDFISGDTGSLRDRGFPSLLPSERSETVIVAGLAIIAIAAINKGADSLAEVYLARGGRSLGYNIRVTMYERLQKLSLAFHDKRRTGDVLTRVTGDVVEVEEFVVSSLSNIVGSFLVVIGSFVLLLTKSVEVALIAIVIVPALAFVSNHFSQKLKKHSKRQRAKEGDLASTAQEMLSSIRLVQSYGRGHVDLERFADQSDQNMRAALSVATVQAQFSFVIAVLEGLTIASVVWLGVVLVDNNSISAGTLVLFVLLIQNMFKPSRKIVSEWYKVGKLLASTERVEELLEREPAVQDSPTARPAPALEGRLRFEDVTFSYDTEDGSSGATGPRKVLHGISFAAEPGEVLALIGPSGAGKSSIAQLVPRLHDPDSGVVSIDDIALRDVTLASLRSQVSLVLQETMLLTGTVAENIGYGIDDPDPERIEQAARLANAHEFIVELPEGYDTVLGERGSTLSGGQRQRLAIARAFIRQAPVLILDEPTTGLDPLASGSVIDALRTLIGGTTTIIISHDVDLVRCADRILVLNDGRIVQEGSPESLAQIDGPYAELFGAAETTQGPSDRASPDGSTLGAALGHLDGSSALSDRMPAAVRVLEPEFARSVADEWVGEHRPGCTVTSATANTLRYKPGGRLTLRVNVHLDGDATSEVVLIVKVGPDGITTTAFPHDPGLPTLSAMFDGPIRYRRSGDGTPIAELDGTPTLVHHPRTGGCVLRYDRADDTSVYAKVYPRRAEAERAARAVGAIDGAVLRGEGGLEIRVPTLLGVDTVRHAVFLDSLTSPDDGSIHDEPVSLSEAATALRALHQYSATSSVPVHLPLDEVDRVNREIRIVAETWPDVANCIEQLIVPARRALGRSGVERRVLSHGDYTPSQLLRRRDGLGMVDLDTLCLAEPEFDIGRYLAYHDLDAARHGASPEVASLARLEFLGVYGPPPSDSVDEFGSRVMDYRAITLGLIALSSVRRFKDRRLHLALRLLAADATER